MSVDFPEHTQSVHPPECATVNAKRLSPDLRNDPVEIVLSVSVDDYEVRPIFLKRVKYPMKI